MTEEGRGTLDLVPMSFTTGVVYLGPVKSGIAVGLVDGEDRFLPNFKVLTLKEEEVVVVLGYTQPSVGSGLVSGAVVVAVLFVDDMVDLGGR